RSREVLVVEKLGSDAALFRWPAAIVWNRRDVANQSEIESDRLQRTHGRFASSARAFDENLHFFESVTHRLPRCILRDQLCRVSRNIARTFETNFARARPANYVSVQICDRDEGIVKARVYVRDVGIHDLGYYYIHITWFLYI